MGADEVDQLGFGIKTHNQRIPYCMNLTQRHTPQMISSSFIELVRLDLGFETRQIRIALLPSLSTTISSWKKDLIIFSAVVPKLGQNLSQEFLLRTTNRQL